MKLNMGCGMNKQRGYVNVDLSPACAPDVLWDLEVTPWPWPDDSAIEIIFRHSLEHMGQSPRVFLAMMKELYRISRNGARILIAVPHPRHDFYLSDPTHVRPITPQTLSHFDHSLNQEWIRIGAANTPLAIYIGVDFVIRNVTTELAEPYRTRVANNRLSETKLQSLLKSRCNVASEYRIELVARKLSKSG